MKYRIKLRGNRYWPQRRRWFIWRDLAPHDADCGPQETHFLAEQALKRHLLWLRNVRVHFSDRPLTDGLTCVNFPHE